MVDQQAQISNFCTYTSGPVSAPFGRGVNHMHRLFKYLLIGVVICTAFDLGLLRADLLEQVPASDARPFGDARMVGRIESDQLVECSGMDASMAHDDLLWAINDSGNGPYLFAMGRNGRDRGRVRVAGAENRDWEDLATFWWQGRPMILIADIGDNDQRHNRYLLYIVQEPKLDAERFQRTAVTEVAWRIDFSYPDRNHDAEGVAVDMVDQKILILTKRDDPPLLFALPLKPPPRNRPVVACQVAVVNGIPPPSTEDRQQTYGAIFSQPTALDLCTDGLTMVVLTYMHAYLYDRLPGDSWAGVASTQPTLIELPPPQDNRHLVQREAICFSRDGRALLVTSEGRGAGIFDLKAR